MWEEHPAYQKQQAKIIGVLAFIIFFLYTGYAISERDWHVLGQTLLFAAALIASVGLLSGSAWLVVKVLLRDREDRKQK